MAESENSIDSRNKLLCLLTESIDAVRSGVILKYYISIYSCFIFIIIYIYLDKCH